MPKGRTIKYTAMKKKFKPDTQAESQFLSILNSGLWGRPVETGVFSCGDLPDWKGIMRLSRTQAVLPLIYDGMMSLPGELRLKGAALLQLIAYVDRIERLNAGLDNSAAEISRRLASDGIRSVLLKGQGNAVLYPVPHHRQCGDIDLYVGNSNYGRALEIIRGWSEIQYEHPESAKHTGFKFGEYTLELHKEAFLMSERKTDRKYRKLEEEELAKDDCKVLLGDGEKAGYVTVPRPQFNVFYTFCHAFHHFMEGGLGLRQMCDLAMLLHRYHDDIDSSELEGWLCEFRLDREWRLFVSLLVNVLQLPPEQAPLYCPEYTSLSFKLLDELFRDGNFGHHKDLPDFSGKPLLMRKIGNLGIHHVLIIRRLKFSRRQAWRHYRHMWENGLKNALRK